MKSQTTAVRQNQSPVLTAAVCTLLLVACTPKPPQALGSIEYDRITLPAPAAERILTVNVREGQRVNAGDIVMTLDKTRTEAQLEAAQAETARQRSVLSELEAGPRQEAIAQARAQLRALDAQATESQRSYERIAALGKQKLIAAIDIDRARANAQAVNAQADASRQALDALINGTRPEQVAAGRSAVSAATSTAKAQAVLLDKLTITAPRNGRIDSLPFKPGDQAPVGAALAVLQADNAPYARIYVLEAQRANVKVGDAVTIKVDGRNSAYRGTIRMIRSEPNFTPYFALTGKDAARLSYLAEVQLGDDARDLPAGLPAHASFSK